MTSPPRESPLQRLFLGRFPAKGVVWFSVPGGQPLYAAGSPSEALYLVRSGRLAVLHSAEGRAPQVLGIVRPGEPVGEMALIAGTHHTSTVVALRDSEVLALPREQFLIEARRRPMLLAELARLSMLRARMNARTATDGSSHASDPTVFGFLGLVEAAGVRAVVERVARRLRGSGLTVAVVGGEALRQSSEWFSALEQAHDIVLLAAEAHEAEWRRVCARQVDQLFLVARQGVAPSPDARLRADEAAMPNRPIELILTRAGDAARTMQAQGWLDVLGCGKLHQLRDGSEVDLSRMTRLLTGTGGGACALGRRRARLRSRRRPAGAARSGGADRPDRRRLDGRDRRRAGVCLGWDPHELDARMRAAFVSSNPLGDMALPMIALSGGRRVTMRLQEHFEEVEFADLDLPFFCVSSNLTSGLPQVHDRGIVRHALRASCALPGIMPPVVVDGEVLVDGGVLRNLPTDIMRERCRGPVVGVDVALTEDLSAADIESPPSLWRFLASGAWKRGPPLVSLLIRSATVTTHREFAAAREASDLLIAPMIDGVGLQDWKLYDRAVEAGYRSASEALEKLDRPLTDLRRPREGPSGVAMLEPASS